MVPDLSKKSEATNPFARVTVGVCVALEGPVRLSGSDKRSLHFFWVAVLLIAIHGGCVSSYKSRLKRAQRGQPIRSPQGAKQANERGLTLVEEGDLVRAEEGFREAIRLDATLASAHNNLGLVLMGKAAFHQAAVALSAAKRLAPRAVEPLINLGQLYETVGWHKLAITQYELALAVDPANAPALGRLAHVCASTGENQERLSGLLQRLAAEGVELPWRSWALARLDALSLNRTSRE